ncbi:MAG: DNA polymerase III subunit alpha [Gammaproteobacteria bacterium]|nr:DNA polymerase III subunit alpha [Gammaproteobacteria bacterium]
MSDPQFIHLRVHSEFSLVDGTVRINALINALADLQMPAVGLTDETNFFALVRLYTAARQRGIKPIAGVDVKLENPDDCNKPFNLTLFAQNNTGYRHLAELISKAYLEGQRDDRILMQWDWLQDSHEGIIALSGAQFGEIGQSLSCGNQAKAIAAARRYSDVFEDRFYIELQRVGRNGEEQYISAAAHLAVTLDLPVVATNDVRFLAADEFEAHEARVCINQGYLLDDPARPRTYTDAQCLKSEAEMLSLFGDYPEALKNTVEIARRCNLSLTLGEVYLPEFPVPAGETTEQYFTRQSQQGLQERLDKLAQHQSLDDQKISEYRNRLQMEIDVIVQMQFPGYFLIVADFIRWARENQIPVGPGRGSGAGSLVAYALRITDLDPLKFDLLFERFLNPERVSMPDFDIDFCMDKRDQVIDYVAERWGRDKVSQIITYGTMAAKAVVRDVGRVLGMSYGYVDRIAKLIPFELGITLEKALEQSAELKSLYDNEDDIQQLIDLARSLEGVARNAGKHAGGVVIAPSKLTDFAPLYCEPGGGSLVTQFDKDDVEAVGLVKFDFLGLRTLTIIDWALAAINAERSQQGQELLNIEDIAIDDPSTYRLLQSCATTAVFQLESRGMKDLVRRLKPDCFEDIIALVALFRPGPLQSGMVDDYINVKHGRQQADYAHPALEKILKPTNGVILYQEQVMEIARELAGYTLGGADLLRRAMGKKKPAEMARQRELFVNGASQKGIDEAIANYIFDLMEKFAGYGFNKSHSAAYALVSYQTAWLKAHYPAAFMAAVLSSDMDNTDKVVILIDECRQLDISVQAPDINRSGHRFNAVSEDCVLYGLGAIKGVGQAAIESLINERQHNGPYASLFDVCNRVDLRKLNRRVLEALIDAGAFDCLEPQRANVLASLEMALQAAEQQESMRDSGQNDMFGFSDVVEQPKQQLMENVLQWTDEERLLREKATLGLYLSGHPIDRCKPELEQIITCQIKNLDLPENSRESRFVRIAGLLLDQRLRQTKRGSQFCSLTLDDNTARTEITLFAKIYEQYAELLVKDTILVIEGNLGMDDYSGQPRLNVEKIYSVEQARSALIKHLVIEWSKRSVKPGQTDFINQLTTIISPYKGGCCPILVDYQNTTTRGRIAFGESWKVNPSDQLLSNLKQAVGADYIRLNY